jgi:hypothetical protein
MVVMIVIVFVAVVAFVAGVRVRVRVMLVVGVIAVDDMRGHILMEKSRHYLYSKESSHEKGDQQ